MVLKKAKKDILSIMDSLSRHIVIPTNFYDDTSTGNMQNEVFNSSSEELSEERRNFFKLIYNMCSEASKDQLIKFMTGHHDQDHLRSLPREKLEIMCREGFAWGLLTQLSN